MPEASKNILKRKGDQEEVIVSQYSVLRTATYCKTYLVGYIKRTTFVCSILGILDDLLNTGLMILNTFWASNKEVKEKNHGVPFIATIVGLGLVRDQGVHVGRGKRQLKIAVIWNVDLVLDLTALLWQISNTEAAINVDTMDELEGARIMEEVVAAEKDLMADTIKELEGTHIFLVMEEVEATENGPRVTETEDKPPNTKIFLKLSLLLRDIII